MSNMGFQDPLENLQYRIFKWVLFILFLAAVYRLLDHDLGITHAVSSLLGY